MNVAMKTLCKMFLLGFVACILSGCPICAYHDFTWHIAVLSEDSLLIEYPQYVYVSVSSTQYGEKVHYSKSEQYRVKGDLFITGNYGYSNLRSDENRKYRESEQKVKITRLSSNAPVKIIVDGYEGHVSPEDLGWLPESENVRDSVFEELVHWYGEEKMVVMPVDMNEAVVSVYKPNALP